MELLFLPPSLRALDEAPAEVLCACLFEDERPPQGVVGLASWRLAGRFDRLIETGFLTGARGEVMLVPGRPRLACDKVLLFGMGARAEFGDDAFDDVTLRILHTLRGLECRAAIVELPGRHADAMAPERAADRFLAAVGREGGFDRLTLVEEGAAQKRINEHVIEARRRVRKW